MLLLSFHLYADDTQLMKHVNVKSVAEQFSAKHELETNVNVIVEWMHSNKLQLNKQKTEFCVFSSPYFANYVDVDSLMFGTDKIESSQLIRNLGVHMDSTLSMVQHVNQIRKTGFYYLNWVKKVRPFLTDYAAKAIIHALVISRLDYCNAVLVNLPDCVISRLQGLMNAAARVITRTPRRASITPVLESLHWLPVYARIDFKVLCLVYKSLHGQAPDYLRNIIQSHDQSRTLRSNDCDLLVVPQARTKYGERSFRHAAPVLWNKLPENTKSISSFYSFKKSLKTHFFNMYY